MATLNHCDANEDFIVCPICFEKYQTPRTLPCTHTFCHRCLSAHIESSCKDCDPALGFPCPVCRAFVPAPGVLRQYPTEDWASRFPENLFLSSCVRKQTSLTNISCGPCRIDCEIDIKAESWCVECEDFLCEKCSQNHRKYKALQSHQIFPIANCGLDYTISLKHIETDIFKYCDKHENRKFNVEFVCKTHQTGCCSLCVVNEHKHCEKISTLLKAVNTFSDKAKVKLVQEIKDLLSKIETIILNEKQNISEVDDRSDTFSEMIKKMIEEMVIRLKTLEKTYLDQLAEVSKDARQKLEGSIRLFEHRRMYLEHWLEIVSTDSPNMKTENVLKCLKTNEVLKAVDDLPLIQMNFDLSAEVRSGIEMIDSLGTLFSVKITERIVNFSDIQNEIISEKHKFSTHPQANQINPVDGTQSPKKRTSSLDGTQSPKKRMSPMNGTLTQSLKKRTNPFYGTQGQKKRTSPVDETQSPKKRTSFVDGTQSPKKRTSLMDETQSPKKRTSPVDGTWRQKANEFRKWDAKPKETNDFSGWDSKSKETIESRGWDRNTRSDQSSWMGLKEAQRSDRVRGWDRNTK